MEIVLRIPDEVASRVAETGADLERQALEAWVADNFRRGTLTKADLRTLLGLQSLNEIDGFLKAHDVYEEYTLDDLDREMRTLDKFGL